ncbi:MAG: glucosamine-6-phosphate deaminase [Phycisphaeraceae bacterium]|nr:glucosamine-6-phosphate deaminase [Phycisphaeraceae bacterium]
MDTHLPEVERVPVEIFPDDRAAVFQAAHRIARRIAGNTADGKRTVLGLATGSTSLGLYEELIRLHRAGEVSFQEVVTFNLDEYYPMAPDALQSYRRFMHECFFDAIDIAPGNIHIPDGTIAADHVADYCRDYEQAIADAGGIDIQILGIGRTGHIGFNEPGSSRSSRTRLITLDRITRADAASDFFGQEHVPRRALTMGVGSIMDAREVLLLAFGEHKAQIIAQAVEGPVSAAVAASFLQEHPNARILLDAAAASELTRRRCPWTLGPVEWTDQTIRKAVIWLARTVGRPILKLTDNDYNEHGMQDLLAAHHGCEEINVAVFRELQASISGWPGGKPDAARRPGDVVRPRDRLFPKRVLVFSPHPDDDVISMGGTLIRLVEHGHEVHVAYQTSGNIAVFDHDALRFADFAADFNRVFGVDRRITDRIDHHVEQFLRNKQPGQVDSDRVQRLKSLIRRGEARAAGRYCGIPMENLHFMDMPFYETGRVRKKPISEEDIRIIVQLLDHIRPHQIYAAGDLTDPHGTHRVCLAAIMTALDRTRGEAWFADTEVWLYRGAWQEWAPEQIDMAVPLGPQELQRKRNAIFRHQSQKDRALFPGPDPREFWQRAEDRNRATAQLYDQLGLAEYEAIEGFVRWTPPDEPQQRTDQTRGNGL